MTARAPVAVYYGDALGRYDFGNEHPFNRHRLDAFWDEVCRRGLDAWVDVRAPQRADRATLERFHSHEYIEQLIALSSGMDGSLDLGDTPVFEGIYEAAATVVGTSVAASEALIAQNCRAAFCPVAGLHHASRKAASGFCALNDVGVVVETLKRVHHLERIVYVDIDVHHGDGVFYAFEDDAALIVADIHEDGRYLFPGTGQAWERGRGAALGCKLNIPLPPGAGDLEFSRAFEQVEAFVDAARPQFLLMQCGADGLRGDPLGDLRLTPNAHALATRTLLRIANRHCNGRLLAMGGGGYNNHNLAAAWCGVIEELLAANGS